MHYVYILYSTNEHSPRRFYVGETSNLRGRLVAHQQQKSIWTNRFGPWILLYYEAYAAKEDAQHRERGLKHHGKGLQELKRRLSCSIAQNQKGAGLTVPGE